MIKFIYIVIYEIYILSIYIKFLVKKCAMKSISMAVFVPTFEILKLLVQLLLENSFIKCTILCILNHLD